MLNAEFYRLYNGLWACNLMLWFCHDFFCDFHQKKLLCFLLFLLWFSIVPSYVVCIESFTLNNLVLNRFQGQSSSGAPGADLHLWCWGECVLPARWLGDPQRETTTSGLLGLSVCDPSEVPSDKQLTVMKSYGGLTYSSALVYRAVHVAESAFRSHQAELSSCCNVESMLNEQFHSLVCYIGLPSCHDDILRNIIKRYFRLRIHAYGKWLTDKSTHDSTQHSSRSAYCRTKVKWRVNSWSVALKPVALKPM